MQPGWRCMLVFFFFLSRARRLASLLTSLCIHITYILVRVGLAFWMPVCVCVCLCVEVGWACGSWASFVCVLHAIYPQQNELMDVFFHLGHIRSEIQGQHLITLERSESESCFIARRYGILLVQMFIRTFAQISYKVSSFFKIQTGWRLDRLVMHFSSQHFVCEFTQFQIMFWILFGALGI